MGSKKDTIRKEQLSGMVGRVKQIVEERGLTVEDLTPKMYRWGAVRLKKFMNGSRTPCWGDAEDFAKALEVSEAWLLGETDDPTLPPTPPRMISNEWEDIAIWLTDPDYSGTPAPCDLSGNNLASLPAWVVALEDFWGELTISQAQKLCNIAHAWVYGRKAPPHPGRVIDLAKERLTRRGEIAANA